MHWTEKGGACLGANGTARFGGRASWTLLHLCISFALPPHVVTCAGVCAPCGCLEKYRGSNGHSIAGCEEVSPLQRVTWHLEQHPASTPYWGVIHPKADNLDNPVCAH